MTHGSRDDQNPEAALAALAPRLRARDDAPAPDPAFVRRLEESLVRSGHEPRPASVAGVLGIAATPNGRTTALSATPRHRIGRQQRRPWLPWMEFAAVAVLFLAIVGGYAAVYRGYLVSDGSGGDRGAMIAAPDVGAIPAVGQAIGTPVTSTGGACTVAPRLPQDRTKPGTPRATLTIPAGATPASPHREPASMSENLLPAGAPAPTEVIAGITATVRELDACAREMFRRTDEESDVDYFLYFMAYYSDDYFRRENDGSRADWIGGHPDDIPTVRDARLLVDGRVGAIAEVGASSVFLVFVQVGDRWLIDE